MTQYTPTQTSSAKRPIARLALTALCLSVAACNTVQGLGEDIQSVGKKGEEIIND